MVSGKKNQANSSKIFTPRPLGELGRDDRDGLSLSRASLTTIDVVATKPGSNKKYHVCRLEVADVMQLGLTVVPMPLPENPAHAVIPELNSCDLKDSVKQTKIQEWALALRDKAVLIYEAPMP